MQDQYTLPKSWYLVLKYYVRKSNLDFGNSNNIYQDLEKSISCKAQEATDIAIRIRRLQSLRVAYEIHVLQVLEVARRTLQQRRRCLPKSALRRDAYEEVLVVLSYLILSK